MGFLGQCILALFSSLYSKSVNFLAVYSAPLSVRNLRGDPDSATYSLNFSRASDFLLINFTTEYFEYSSTNVIVYLDPLRLGTSNGPSICE